MVTVLRRKLSRLLAVAAVKINPDPALSFTTTSVRRIEDSYIDRDMVNWMAGEIVGHGIAGRPFTPGEDVKRAL